MMFLDRVWRKLPAVRLRRARAAPGPRDADGGKAETRRIACLYEFIQKNTYARALAVLSRPYVRCISGFENIPTKGNVIFIANHNSLLDSFLLTSHLVLRTGRIVYILGDKSTWKSGSLRAFVSWLMANGIMVDRDDPNDIRRGLKHCITKLKEGDRMLIFPEGTRGVPEEIAEFKKGLHLVAFRSKASIVPVALRNVSLLSHKGKRFPSPLKALFKLSINVGPEIRYAEYERYRKKHDEFCAYLREKVCELYRQAEGRHPGVSFCRSSDRKTEMVEPSSGPTGPAASCEWRNRN